MSVFEDQKVFMGACGQTTSQENIQQFELYKTLITEEFSELLYASENQDKTEIFDALLDVIVCCVGAGLSLGLPMEKGWEEVIRSNMQKVDKETGRVRKREDGKILKPDGWTPPKLSDLLTESIEACME